MAFVTHGAPTDTNVPMGAIALDLTNGRIWQRNSSANGWDAIGYILDGDGAPQQFKVTNAGAGAIGFRNAGAGNQQFNIDCYVNDSGALIASATTGSRWIQGSGVLRWDYFTGATIGDDIGSSLVAGLTLDLTSGALTAEKAFIGSVQALTTAAGAGAVNTTTLLTKLTSTGTDALTLANGTDGQIKIITMIVDGGDATLTPTTKTGFTTVLFDAVGDSVTLTYFTTLGWMVSAVNGATVS